MVPLEQALQMARLASQAGRLDEAEHIYRQILRAVPDEAFVWNELGLVLLSRKQTDEAAQALSRAVELSPSDPAYHSNLGVALRELGERGQAEQCYRRALALDPSLAQVHNNLAIVLADGNRLAEAVESYQEALALKPDYSEAHYNLGNAWRAMGQYEQARAAYEAAVRLAPSDADSLRALASVLSRSGQFAAAEARYRELVALRPDDPEPHAALAGALHQQCRMDEALAAFQRTAALSSQPAAERIRLATLLPPLYRSREELCAWRERIEREVERLVHDGCVCDLAERLPPSMTTSFYTAYQGVSNRALHQSIARLYRAPQLDVARPRAEVPGSGPPTNRRLRIGFLSRYFYNHTIGCFTCGYIARLDRQRFETHVLAINPRQDQMGQFIRQHADRYDELPADLAAARRMVLERRLDVLVYPEIGMSPTAYALAASRLAPVQCVTWGHPDTTGLPTIDYFLSSRELEPPGAEEHYSERLVRFEHPPACYFRPTRSGPGRTRRDFGLDDASHVYGCLQSLFKFHPDFDAVLVEILRRDPAGVLALVESCPAWEAVLRERLARLAPDVLPRVRFLPRMEKELYLDCLAGCDVLLDPLHFGGGNTSYEGLALGLPIVTLPGELMRGRVTYALYRQMGALDAVVSDAASYVERAVSLGCDRELRDHVSRRILAANDVLFENQAAVAELELFLERACEGI